MQSQVWAKSIKLKKHQSDELKPITLSEHTNHLIENFEKIKDKLKPELQKPILLAIQLHDIGKVLPYFQRKKLGNKNYKPYDVMIDIEHSIFSSLLINKEALLQEILSSGLDKKYSDLIVSAVAFHHWRDKFDDLLRFGNKNFERFQNSSEEFKNQLIKNLTYEVEKIKYFNKDLIGIDHDMISGLANGIPFTEYAIPPYQIYYLNLRIDLNENLTKDWILIAGFLIRCDHFASFCEEENYESQIEIPQKQEEEIFTNISNIIKSKRTFTGNKIWQIEKIADCKNANTILIAPTGFGKTEFAFLWAGENKLIYTLPLRAAVEQTFERAKEIYNSDNLERVGLLHFDADVYLINEDNEEVAIKLYDNAKQLSFPVTISTGDQFFPYALRPPGYEKIYSIFSYANLIVDEVQAYDPIASAIIVKFCKDVYTMGGKFLIMTATLPTFIKEEIEKNIPDLNDSNFINIYQENKSLLQNLRKHKIRLLEIQNDKIKDESKFKLNESILNEIIDLGRTNRVLVVVNTIALAQKIYDQINEKLNDLPKDSQISLYLLHSRYTFNDREKLQSEITSAFSNPKWENEKDGKILIATQVIESAIDIDADFLYTEIAPLDSLVQRMGRVYRRYNKDFVYSYDLPNVNILIYSDGYESGNGRVYHNELLENTIKILIGLFEPEKHSDKNEFSSVEKRKTKQIKIQLPTDILAKSYLISEYEKYEIVQKLYYSLSNSQYLTQFYSTLDLLDAGYMADKKIEAQRRFRPMVSTSVISRSKLNELKDALEKFISNFDHYKRPYTMFKEKIISEFVINILGIKKQNSENSLSNWIENNFNLTHEMRLKLLNWTRDIYLVDFNYNNKRGLDNKINEHLIDKANIL